MNSKTMHYVWLGIAICGVFHFTLSAMIWLMWYYIIFVFMGPGPEVILKFVTKALPTILLLPGFSVAVVLLKRRKRGAKRFILILLVLTVAACIFELIQRHPDIISHGPGGGEEYFNWWWR